MRPGAPAVAVDFSDLDRARLVLDRTHAFADPNEADAAGIRLVLPSHEVVADAPQKEEDYISLDRPANVPDFVTASTAAPEWPPFDAS
jgi:hypothetical protein